MVDFDQVNLAVNGAFGEALVYQPAAGGVPRTIDGVFTDAYKMAFQDGQGGVGWTTTSPSVGVRLADLHAPPAKDDRITRVKTGQTYLVFDQKPNGIGWTHIELKKTS